MKSKKKFLLLGVGVMGALALGVGATSTFAWFTVSQASLAKGADDTYSVTITKDSAADSNVTITPVVSATTGAIRPTDSNGDVWYWISGTNTLVKDVQHSGKTVTGNWLEIVVDLEATVTAVQSGETILDIMGRATGTLKVKLEAIDFDSTVTLPTGKTQGNNSYVKIAESKDSMWASSSHSVTTASSITYASGWTKDTSLDTKATKSSAATFYVGLIGGSGSETTRGSEAGITLDTDAFRLNVSVVI